MMLSSPEAHQGHVKRTHAVSGYPKVNKVRVRVILGLGLEEVFVFDSKSENRDRAVD